MKKYNLLLLELVRTALVNALLLSQIGSAGLDSPLKEFKASNLLLLANLKYTFATNNFQNNLTANI